MPEPGTRLLDFLHELQTTTSWRVATEKPHSQWQLAGKTWQATVVVEPGRWLGLEFEAQDPVTGRRATYDIDTDLYDITRDEVFAEEVESDIIEFLANLRSGAVRRGNDGAKFVLVFPREGAYVRVVQGRVMTRASAHAGPLGGDFVAVD
ncbi:hypothetical protein ABJI51_38200 [Amycolatopsis sp. NEAU-NG30]|uniref:Uncharacterized protein n=1 Tax=Amycolatopsis melonis TaxID=3156488 RepID=A0ABV0LRP5_9PSEU